MVKTKQKITKSNMITCDHANAHLLTTAAGQFCMNCGQLTVPAKLNKTVVRHASRRLQKTVSSIRPANPTSKIHIGTATIGAHRIHRLAS
jgi:hypothetical protein